MYDLQHVIFSIAGHLKSFDYRNMKSKVVLIFCLFAMSQGAIPSYRASFCLWFPEHCKSTKSSEGTFTFLILGVSKSQALYLIQIHFETASTTASSTVPTLAPTTASTLDLESFKEKISQLESEISNMKSKDSELGSEISNLDSEVSNLKMKDTKLSSEITNLAKDVEKLGPCPSGWVDGGRLGCYYVASKSSSMTHHDAKKFCKSLDNRAHLVEIRTEEIQKYVESLDLSSNAHWWMGATDLKKV